MLLQSGVSDQIAVHIVASGTDSPIYQSYFLEFPDNFTSEEIEDLQTRAATVLGDEVR